MQKTLINREDTKYVGKFGVELELTNVHPQQVIAALKIKGIDCEVEGYNHTTRSHWKLVTDSSIRQVGNDGSPYELVSPPLNGRKGLMELRDVCLALYFVGVKTNKSCGVHIHHNAPTLNETQKNNLLCMYARMERTIDAFMPKSRKRNNNAYCKSMIWAYEQSAGYNSLRHLGRYNKLNFESLGRHNTLEFRQHGGTIEFEKLYHWIIFTANFLHLCKDKTSRRTMNFVERAWTPKHLKLSKGVWAWFKKRMKELDDLDNSMQNAPVSMASLRAADLDGAMTRDERAAHNERVRAMTRANDERLTYTTCSESELDQSLNEQLNQRSSFVF